MPSEKSKAKGGPPQKHLHSRISYLFQAATYLAETSSKVQLCNKNDEADDQIAKKRSEDSAVSEAHLRRRPHVVPSTQDKYEAGNTVVEACYTTQNQNIGPSRQLLAHVRAVSLKGQIRLSPKMKQSICKRCDQLLVPGSSATVYMENKSRGEKKPWADVLVINCMACGTGKRFPVGARRQLRKGVRPTQAKDEADRTRAPT